MCGYPPPVAARHRGIDTQLHWSHWRSLPCPTTRRLASITRACQRSFPVPTHDSPRHPDRLNRYQQLTLTTWRFAAIKVNRCLDPTDMLAHVAVQTVLATLRDVDQPLALFSRHQTAEPEYALVNSLLRESPHRELALDLLDAAFLGRWNELIADGCGPEELPPLRRRTSVPTTPDA